MSTEQQQLENAILTFEAQRSLLGDSMVDMAVAPLKAKLAALLGTTSPDLPDPVQTLKQVTILFLDVVGSTTLSQHLDPEAISAVMDDALLRGTAVVEAHRGRVLQYAGDNILAAFGADESREDDPERAVHCGLALLELGKTLGLEVLNVHGHPRFDVRVGIHTGGVLLGGGVDADGIIRDTRRICRSRWMRVPANLPRIDTHLPILVSARATGSHSALDFTTLSRLADECSTSSDYST